MPLFEYLCKLCGRKTEHLLHADAPAPICTTSAPCATGVQVKLVSVPGVPVITVGGTGAQSDG